MDHWGSAANCPEQVVEEVEFGTVAMYHGTRYGHHNGGIVSGLLKRFASIQPRLILFGHSHIPLIEDGADGIILNPGSASFPRYDGPPTVALVEYDEENDKLTARHIEL